MKKYILIALFLLFLQNAFAQDVILKLNGEEITVRVSEINLNEIVYQHPDSAQGLVYRIPKAEVFMVTFANGTKEMTSSTMHGNKLQTKVYNQNEMYALGQNDAKKYYKGNDVMWTSAASTLLVPVGLVVPVSLAISKPKIKNHAVSDVELLSDSFYVKGYEKEAHKKKAGKALAGTGIGVLTLATALVFLFNGFH
jgi:hypothetical protein